MTAVISGRWTQVGFLAMAVVAGCSETAGPASRSPSVVVNGTVTDAMGVPIPGSEVRLWLNHVFNWAYFAETFTDSLGRFRFRFDSLPAPLDSIVGTARGPGCAVEAEAFSVSVPPTWSLTPETVLSTQIALTKAPPRATGDTGRLNGRAADGGQSGVKFGYAGCLLVIIEQSTVVQPTGEIVLLGQWDIGWSPIYGDDVGTFQGVQTDSGVSLTFDEGGCTTRWEAPVNSDGVWGTLTSTSEACPASNWGTYPVTLARDTSSRPWPAN